MKRRHSIDRRTYLAAAAAVGTGTIAGCLDGVTGSASSGPDDGVGGDTYLPEPDSQVDPADLPYPGYGQPLPDVTVPAPLHGEEVSVRQLDTDVLVTFFYSYCRTVCPRLVGTLRNIQTEAASDGYSDEVTFLAVTFDPERDTETRLREYANHLNVDLDAGNWYFLRPESVERAQTVVDDEFGVAFERTTPEGMDRYMFTHFSLTLLANTGGRVERTYISKRPAWQEIYDEFTSLRELEG